jgi:hypothetical protein
MTTIAVTLGFTPARVLEAGMNAFYATAEPGNIDAHYFLDQHYPLRRKHNVKDLRDICKQHDMKWVDSGQDRGLVDGFNYLMTRVQPDDDDLIITYDPDSEALTPGWNTAMIDAMRGDESLAWVSLLCTQIARNIEGRFLPGDYIEAGGRCVFIPNRIDMISVSCFRWSFLKAIGGLRGHYKYYGQVEIPLYQAAHSMNMRYGYLTDFIELSADAGGFGRLHDPEYTAWKQAHIHGYSGRFEEWLRANHLR